MPQLSHNLPATARAGRLILVDETARDGAQGKTLLLAPQRLALARRNAAVFGDAADDCLVNMVGFPAIGPQERQCILEVIAQLKVGYQEVVTRTRRADILQGIALMRGAHRGRVLFVLPASDKMARAMLHCSAREALQQGLVLLEDAVAHAAGRVSIDVCLADMASACVEHLVSAAGALTRKGAEVIMLADTTGGMHPVAVRRFLGQVTPALDDEVVIHAHFHNDLGLALSHNLDAIAHGHRIIGCSWLGLGERAGIGRAEELLGLLATASEEDLRALGTSREQLGITHWNTPAIYTTARWVAAQLSLPPRVTDPIVGTGVNSISTGTPFVEPATFQPFDAEAVLGVKPTVVLTHLASRRVIAAIGEELGLHLTPEEVVALQAWTKQVAYDAGQAVVSKSALAHELQRMRSARDGASQPRPQDVA